MVEAVFPPEPSEPLRIDELNRLRTRLEADHGGAVVLHGPRGVGKEHLATCLVRHAKQLGGALILEGRTPAAGGRSFHPFAELVRQAMTWAEQNGLSERIVDPVLGDLHPVLDHQPGEAPSSPALDLKLRFFEAVRRMLAAISENVRLLAVVHDLERADGDTLELAGYLADNLFGDASLDPAHVRPGMLLLLVRDDRTTPQRARDFLAELEERRTVEAIRLAGLDLEGLRQYVQSPRVLEKLMAASDGIPREIDELIDALPTNVEELFVRRLEAMDPISRKVLRALALTDRPAPARVIAAVTGQPIKDVATALAAQREARVLERRIHNGELQFSFARRSNLEVSARTASAEELAQLHTGWANALAEASNVTEVGLLAHHQLRSTEPARGVPLAIRAAEAHAVSGAFDAAAQLLEEALPHGRGELRSAILGRLSELASLRGKPREALRWVELWKAELPESERGKALIRESELFNAAGDYDRALKLLEQARVAAIAAPNEQRAAIEAATAEALYQLGNLEAAKTAGELGLELLCREEDSAPRARIEVLNLLGKIELSADRSAEALSIFEHTLLLSQARALAREEARALVNIGHAKMKSGLHDEAEQSLLAGARRANEANELSHLAFATLNLGVLAHRRGLLGAAIEHYRTCRSLFQRLGNRTQLARVLNNLANIYLTAGDLQRARAHNDEALRLATAGGVERLVAAATLLDGILLVEEGQRSAAENRLRQAMVHQRRLGAEGPLETLLELAKIQLRGGDLERSAEMLTEVERAPDLQKNRWLAARARLLRGEIQRERGDAAALATLLGAREDVESLGERLLLRDAELALGCAYADRGQRETARMHLMAAEGLQREVATRLPQELRGPFESARQQVQVSLALAALDRPDGHAPVIPRAIEPELEPEPIEEPAPEPVARTSSPPPSARSADWQKRYGAIVGSSPKILRVFHILDRIAQSENTVLIVGESGTGKELIAEAMHKNSPRAKGPFVKLNCAALVESLLLSELFGHERGSFTGAHQRKIGRFEMAAGGTIFLDEIGDISPKTQVSLLRVLQEREFERVGGGKAIRLEARVLCATNRNLAQMVRDGTFREDLYYRLKGLSVDLPPLRERPEDIEELASSFLARYAQESGTGAKKLSAAAASMLRSYEWPGNVRELENVIRSVALFADSQIIDRRDFDEYRELFEDAPAFDRALSQTAPARPAVVTRSERPAPVVVETPMPEAPVPLHAVAPPPLTSEAQRSLMQEAEASVMKKIFSQGVPLAQLKRKIQEEAIAQALKMSKGNITRAAEMLGMKRPRLSQIINANEELKMLCHGGGR